MSKNTQHSGTVKRLIKDKGFGFIQSTTNDSQEYFFHRSSVTRGRFDELAEGDPVEFVASQSPKGLRAENVDLLR